MLFLLYIYIPTATAVYIERHTAAYKNKMGEFIEKIKAFGRACILPARTLRCDVLDVEEKDASIDDWMDGRLTDGPYVRKTAAVEAA